MQLFSKVLIPSSCLLNHFDTIPIVFESFLVFKYDKMSEAQLVDFLF